MPPRPATHWPRNGTKILFVPFNDGTVVCLHRDFLGNSPGLKLQQRAHNGIRFLSPAGPGILARITFFCKAISLFPLQFTGKKGYWMAIAVILTLLQCRTDRIIAGITAYAPGSVRLWQI